MTHEHMLMPHPVLRPRISDYVASARFAMNSSPAQRIRGDMVINTTLDLSCNTLEQLVDDGAAKFYVMARCANTYRRHAFSSKEPALEIRIPVDDLSGRLVLTPYVIASEPITEFVSDEHDSEIRSVGGVDVPCGSILAVGESHEVDLGTVGSIKSCISLVPNPKVHKGTYAIEAEDEFIMIAVDPEMHEDITRMRMHANAVFYPSIYQAAVEYAIREMEEHPDSKWAQALKNTLNRHDITIDDSLIKDAHLHAQILLEKPLARMVEWSKRRETDD